MFDHEVDRFQGVIVKLAEMTDGEKARFASELEQVWFIPRTLTPVHCFVAFFRRWRFGGRKGNAPFGFTFRKSWPF